MIILHMIKSNSVWNFWPLLGFIHLLKPRSWDHESHCWNVSIWRGVQKNVQSFRCTIHSTCTLLMKRKKNFTFQHDNDPKHKPKSTKEWLCKEMINVFAWPSQCLDLNPIEDLWSDLRTVHRKPLLTNQFYKPGAFLQLRLLTLCWYNISYWRRKISDMIMSSNPTLPSCRGWVLGQNL